MAYTRLSLFIKRHQKTQHNTPIRASAAPAPLRSIKEDELREQLTKDNTGPTKGKLGDLADRGGEEVRCMYMCMGCFVSGCGSGRVDGLAYYLLNHHPDPSTPPMPSLHTGHEDHRGADQGAALPAIPEREGGDGAGRHLPGPQGQVLLGARPRRVPPRRPRRCVFVCVYIRSY